MSATRNVSAWGLAEKRGGRKGKLISAEYAPFWHPIKTAVFSTRNDALRYMIRAGIDQQVEPVQLTIKIEKEENDT